MQLSINGQPREVPDGARLADLIAQRRGVAAAVNGAVVRSADWARTELSAGDLVEFVSAHQGG